MDIDEGQNSLSSMLDNIRAEGSQDYPSSAQLHSSTLTSDIPSHRIDTTRIPAIYPGVYSEFEYLDKKKLLSTPVRQRFFPRASPSVLKALLETPPMRLYSPAHPSYEPCTKLGQGVDSSARVLETSFLAKWHGLDETQSSRTPARASLRNVTPLPLRLGLLPSSSAAPDLDLASSDSFALSLPTSDTGTFPAVHMYTPTQSARASLSNSESHSHSISDPFVASRRSFRSHAHPTGPPALSCRFLELLCPTVAASAAPTRAAEREGPLSPSSPPMRFTRPYDPRRVIGSGLSVGTVKDYQRVMRELQRQGSGDDHWHNRRRSALAHSDEEDIDIGIEPPSPCPKPGRGYLLLDTELNLKLELGLELKPLDMARGSPFSGSVADCPYSYPYSHSQLAASASVSDAGIAELELQAHGLGHGYGRDSFRLAATASAPLLCSLGPDLGSDDSAYTHTLDVIEGTQRTSTPAGRFRFRQPRFSLHVAGDGSSSSSSSGSAGGSGVCASDGSCLRKSSTFEAMRRDFIALLSDQADEEEAQTGQLRAVAERLEKRARSKRQLVDALA